MTTHLTLLSRTYCHLCDDLLAALQPTLSRTGLTVQVLDVDADPQLEEKYGDLVPVLLGNGEEICHYFLDQQALDAFVSRIS